LTVNKKIPKKLSGMTISRVNHPKPSRK